MTLTSFVFANSGWAEPDLFAVTLANGAVIRATSHSLPLVGPDGFTYSPNAFGKWERGGITFERNALTSCDVTVTADTTVMFPGTTTPMLWVSKLFARASITITTCTIDLAAPTTIVGSVVMFVGRCTAPSMTSTQATLHCADETYLLSEPWPRRVICAGCPWTLFDAQCTLNRDSFAISCAVGAGSTQTNLVLGYNKNLITWSEQIDNAAWVKTNAIVTPNALLDPNGNLTADSVAFSVTGTGTFLEQLVRPTVTVAGKVVTWGVWLRTVSGTAHLNVLLEDQANAVIANTTFALTTTWQLCTVTGTMLSTSTGFDAFIYNPDQTAIAYGVSEAQLEFGPVRTTYVQTTAAPTLTLGSVGNDSLPYSKGYIVPTSGQAVGWPIMVTLQSDTTHLNVQPFPLPLAVGDAFTLYPGCDGQKATCEFKFANKQNFGGFPSTPGPAGALSATGS
jgi:hypothetical protein